MKNVIPASYQELIKQAGNYCNISIPKAEDLLKHYGFKGLALHAQAPIFYVVDYVHQKYLFIDPSSKSLLGYDSEDLAEEGPLFYTSLWHKADFAVANQHIFPGILRFLKNQPSATIPDLSFSFNYRVKAKNGNYCTVIQRSTFFVNPTNSAPLAAVGFIIDISHFKEDTKIIFTIEKVDRGFYNLSNTPLHKEVYYPEDAPCILSKREIEILKLICQGECSKQIAATLNIALNTVNNHRKNMLAKTGCANTAELINYALENKILISNRR